MALCAPIEPRKKEYACSVPGVAEMIPRGLKRALDVGCSSGGLGLYLKTTAGYETVVGIEYSAAAAEKAKLHLDAVFLGDASTIKLPAEYAEYFDVIVYADVLEHLYDPWSAIGGQLAWLKPQGYVAASIPNIKNLFVILNLLAGRFDYAEFGLLDRTHIRFFTSQTAVELFLQNGLRLVDFRRSFRPAAWHAEMNAGNPADPGILTVYENIYQKFIQGQDCTGDLKQCFGLFAFSPEAVADLFTAQYHMLFQRREE